ncbi:nucleoside-diphosphate-sugar epimerase [Azospirillum baldaniorum]|uniref:NAD-dependent epimerase/dehydratase family protein n=1 Tax=Azospirillum baldaniorum TaxID=1064539 RepID=UPI0011A981CF|nr:NAD-dependent epimerase/dehydratase family protein [Azospirillum baldaniorum]TWA60425.1 nucleoside-diphosphate-sugar epimerase [Azospirillum baldaniorum]
MTHRTALVLGATGGIGGHVARRLRNGGWTVRALARDPGKAGAQGGLEWIRGDALSASAVAHAAQGASLIVHAVNPPTYRNWGKLVLPMLANTIAAARASGARILLPGTVYNYGPDAFPLLDESSPQTPLTRKGAIRVEMERHLRMASDKGDVRVLIVRAGDFFGPGAGNSWFSQGLVKPGRRLRSLTYPGKAGVGHQWAYLPDVAETMVRLAEREARDAFATFHMGGHWDEDGTRVLEAIRRVVGEPDLPVRRLPWLLMTAASPFVPLFRELVEMRYLWETPVKLNNARLTAELGAEPHTPLDEAVRATLVGLGCLPGYQRTAATCPTV